MLQTVLLAITCAVGSPVNQAEESPVPKAAKVPSVRMKKSTQIAEDWFYRLYFPSGETCETILYREVRVVSGADISGIEPLIARAEASYVYEDAEVVDRVFQCRAGNRCAQQWRPHTLKIDLFEGDFHGDFISDFEMLDMSAISVISTRLAKLLRNSDLKGFGIGRVVVVKRGQKPLKKPFTSKDLAVLQFRGRACENPLLIENAPNACPHCGFKPLVCPACHHAHTFCPDCRKTTWVTARRHKGKDDRRLVFYPNPKARLLPVLNGVKWDGSDFIYGGFISKRALRFLQKHKVSRYCAVPVEVDLEGVTVKQLKALKKAGCVED